MKYFFLHGKGDFIQHIFDNLKDELNKQKHEIYEHNLDGYITDGINKCFIDYQIERVESKARVETYSSNKFTYSYRENVVARLLAKKVDYGSEGWDVFNLQYSIERIEPIQTILSPEATRNYQKIFNFLWKVKRIEQSLKDIWIIYCKDYSRETPKRRSNDEMEFAIVFRDCHILRAKMSHFLTNFYR